MAYMGLAALLVLAFFLYRHGGLQEPLKPGPGAEGVDFPGFPVDINTAGVDSLVLLPGVGRATAEAIIAEREISGGFATLEEIQNVRGIGKRRFSALKDFIVIKKEAALSRRD